MRSLLLLVLLLLPTLSPAATMSCPSGTLTPTAITTTATASANAIVAHNLPAMVFQAVNTAGTATVEIQVCCVGPCATVGNWAQVENSPMSLTVSTAAKGIISPTCQYRAYVSACSTCNVTVGYACAGP